MDNSDTRWRKRKFLQKNQKIENLEGLEARKAGGLKDQKSAFHSTEVPWAGASFPEGLLRTETDECSH